MSTSPVKRRGGPNAPAIFTVDELHEVVRVVKEHGAFAFDVETRGNIERHADIMKLVEAEWAEKDASLKNRHPNQLARSRKTIEDAWRKVVALDPMRNEVFWISIATNGHSWAIPMGHPNGEVIVPEQVGDGSTVPPPGHRDILKSGKESMKKQKYFIPAVMSEPPEQLTHSQVFEVLEEIFMDPTIRKVNQNIKFDAKSVAKYMGGQLPQGELVDTQVLMHLYDENQGNRFIGREGFSLEAIVKRIFKFNPYEREGKIGKTIVNEPFGRACRYAHYDARWAWLTYATLWDRLARNEDLYRALLNEVPMIGVLARMEMRGIEVNQRAMVSVGKELDRLLNGKLFIIGDYTWPGFNPDSNNDCRELLFNKKKTPKDWDVEELGEYHKGLSLQPRKVSAKTGAPSVDADTLRSYEGKHPVIDALLQYNELKKLKSTYIEGLTPKLHDGRLHTQFHLHRTATGRLSSSDPNLQNIPRDSRIRSLFVAEKDRSLIVADYDQIELRVMAMFSQDPALLHIFQNGIDVHAGTAGVILGKDPEAVTGEERTIYGKAPNFLMGYGGGPQRLVEACEGKITVERAKEIIDQYNEGYAGLTEWKYRALAKGRKYGYVETLGGRRRRLPDLNCETYTKDGWKARSRAERQAINAIIQGTAGEICKEAMVKLDKTLDGTDAWMLLQVHDELVVSVPTDQISTWEPVVESDMGNGRIMMGVPLNVTAHHAGSWNDAKG